MTKYRKSSPILFTLVLALAFLQVSAQTGIRNNGAILRVADNSYIKVTGGSTADFTNNTENATEPKIELDGSILMEGDWTNNSSSVVFINRDATGEVIFNGSVAQNIYGPTSTTFESVELNNSAGLTINTTTTLEQGLVLTSGLLSLGSNNLEIGSSGSITGSFNSSTMVVADGSGMLKKNIDANGSYSFPVGDNTSTAEYTPVSFTLNSNGGLSSAWIGVKLVDAKHPNDTSPSEYLSRYWTIDAGGITAPDYNVTLNYVDADINGNEADIFNARYDGGTGTTYGRVDDASNQVMFASLSSFSDFAGIAGLVEVIPSNSGDWGTEVGTTYSYTDVIIPDDITIDLTASKASAEVNNLTIQSLGALSVNGTLNVTGNFTIESDNTGTGSLIDKGILSIEGNTYINRYLGTNGTTNNWRYVSSPVDSAFSAVIDPEASGSYLFWWDEPNDAYQEITTNSDKLPAMRGYAVASDAARTLTFEGTPHTGIFDTTLTRTSTSGYEGFNLVGNPYPSSVNWDTTTWNNTNINNTIWYRTSGNFATYNKEFDEGTNGGQKFIPAMQAFWVRVTDGNSTGTLGANNDIRTHKHQTFYKKNKPKRDNIFSLIADNNGYSDEILLGFFEEASNYYGTYDSEKMFTTNEKYPQLYMPVEGRELVINGMKTFDDEYEIPVGIRIMKEGEFTLRVPNVSQFNSGIDVFLEDKFENTYTNLRENPEYTFSSEETDTTDRFVLHFKKTVTDMPGIGKEGEIDIYSFEEAIFIDVEKLDFVENETQIKIFNALGQEVYNTKTVMSMGKNRVSPGLKSGYYVVKLINKNEVKTQTVYLNRRK